MNFFKSYIALGCLCALLATFGCVPAKVGDEAGRPPDIAETAPGSLGLDVVSYQWNYLNDGAHIRVWGQIMNTSGTPFQSVTLHAMLYDQKGRLLARGSSYIAPSYLKPGAVGEFEFVAVAAHDSGVSNTRLLGNFQSNAL